MKIEEDPLLKHLNDAMSSFYQARYLFDNALSFDEEIYSDICTMQDALTRFQSKIKKRMARNETSIE